MIGRPLISHYFDKRDLQRISQVKQRISQGNVTSPATYFSGNVASPAQRTGIYQVTLPALMKFWANFTDFKPEINIIECKTETKNLNILMQDCSL